MDEQEWIDFLLSLSDEVLELVLLGEKDDE